MSLRLVIRRVLCWSALVVGAASLQAAEKLNVLFIAVDDLRPELGCYGAAHMHTPNLDKFAAGALLFERAYCQVAVCNPSRSSMLSGCRPDTTGILANNKFLRPSLPDVVTLPQHFKNEGYYSVSLGKIFHHSEKEPGDDPQSWSEPAWYHGTPYQSWFAPESKEFLSRLKKLPKNEQPRLMRGPPFEAADAPEAGYPDAQTAAQAITTLQRLQDRPFFFGVGFVKPHLPFTAPRKYWDLYPPESIQLAANGMLPTGAPAPAVDDIYELRTYGGIPAKGPITDDVKRNLIRGYRACISLLDAQVGRVLDELDRLGLSDNTIVVLWGDHGYHLGENGAWTKMTNFELGTRVPLLIRTPKQKTAGKRSAALVELVDLYPTLTELCGLPLPQHLEGLSFAPLLTDPAQPWKQAAFSEYLRRGPEGFHGRSIRTSDWRYTEWVDRKGASGGVELYDHRRKTDGSDPPEAVNLADDPQYARQVAELAKLLKAGYKAAPPPQ